MNGCHIPPQTDKNEPKATENESLGDKRNSWQTSWTLQGPTNTFSTYVV